MIEKKAYPDAIRYISSTTGAIPAYTEKRWCDNDVVDSTISFYYQLAREAGIRLDILVEIPASGLSVPDTNLCVIFGNLLENAIDSCRMAQTGNTFIQLSSKISGQMLFITMDNTCSGCLRQADGDYMSTKHSGQGIGLRSISSLAEQHGGSAEFRVIDDIFRSEVCLKIH